MIHSVGIGFIPAVFAKEIILLSCSKSGMAVCSAYKTHLVRIGPKFLLERHPIFQGFSCILTRKHLVFLGYHHVTRNNVAKIPGFIVCKLIRW